EDGIRDFHVTGVQTCALPISGPRRSRRYKGQHAHLVEFGTALRSYKGANRGRMPARPFLRPSWERTKDKVVDGIRVATGQVVYKIGRASCRGRGEGRVVDSS